MNILWDTNSEKDFFRKSLQFSRPEKLFYQTKNGKYYAYWPKNYDGQKNTLQSRNALIGSYTERWCADLFNELAEEVGGYSVEGVICEDIGLTNQSSADVAICRSKDIIQSAQNILMIIEVKMSVVWNWELVVRNKTDFDLICIGDYTSHQGNPSLLRSDTMLKAIGKSINIRVSRYSSSKIPIIVIGNTPITKSYYTKVDQLKKNGIIQGFWSLNPKPLGGSKEGLKSTVYKGFVKMDKYEEFKQSALALLEENKEFFSSMQSKRQLGKYIQVANKELGYEAKAEQFLRFLRESNE